MPLKINDIHSRENHRTGEMVLHNYIYIIMGWLFFQRPNIKLGIICYQKDLKA